MSLTSCYKYAIELPASTLSELLQTVIRQGQTAGLPITYEDTGVVLGAYTADVSASLVDTDARLSTLAFTAVDLETILHLHMDVRVDLPSLPGLDGVVYRPDFQLPGVVGRDDSVSPAMIQITFPAVTAASLNLVLPPAELGYTAALFEPSVHQMYLDNPGLQSDTQTGVFTPDHGNVAVLTEIFDSLAQPIQVELPTPTVLRLRFPGRMRFYNPGLVEDFTFQIVVDIPIVDESAEPVPQIVVALSTVTTADIGITFYGDVPIYADALIAPTMEQQIIDTFSTVGDITRPVPGHADVQAVIEAAIVDFASSLSVPLFPLAPTAGTIDISSAEPQTVAANVLVLKIEHEAADPCDTPDDFTAGGPVAIAMGAREVQRRLDAAADSLDGMETNAGGYDVTIHRPTIGLEDPGEHGETEGHFWVSGSVTAHVGGCVGDVDADYFGALMLDPVMNLDGTIGFTLRAGNFGGDSEVKDKKDEFDPDQVAAIIEGWDFEFPTIPSSFVGVGTLMLTITQAAISREGIVLTGGVSIQSLSAQLMDGVLPYSLIWGHEPAGG